MTRSLRITVVGSGYVGTVVAACFAHVGHRVVGVETHPERLAILQSGSSPIYEAGLDGLIAEGLETGSLRFTASMSDASVGTDLIFVCVGTPTSLGGHPDMSAVAAAGRAIGEAITGDVVIVTKSTVPIGSGMWLQAVVEEARNANEASSQVAIVSNPEFLREGSAVADFLYPERVVIGGDNPAALATVTAAYRPLLDQTFRGGRTDVHPVLVQTGLATAETIKYAANAFLASKISFINEIAGLCERVGADVTEVAHAIGLDHRIGREFLNAGVGWGGSCFGKDLDALAATARDYGLAPRMLEAARAVNTSQRKLVVEKLQFRLKTLRGKRIALLGLAFKPGTDDTRDSPAIDIASRLIELGATVSGYDPAVKSLPQFAELIGGTDAYEAAERADALVLVTDWPDFVRLDFGRLADVMRGNFVFDGRNALDRAKVEAAGLVYEGVGRGSVGYESPLARLQGS